MQTTLLLNSSESSSQDSANFSVNYIPPIELDPAKQYEIGLISCTCWNAIHNVKNDVNDTFWFTTFTASSISTTKKVKIPQGAYNITDLNKTIKELIKKAGGVDDNFELTPNYNTLRDRMTLKNMKIDFEPIERSIAQLLGFTKKSYEARDQAITYDSELLADITEVNTILVNCSIASGSYTSKGSKGHTIYSFSPDVPPGSLMQITPRHIIYYPLNLENQISSITMQLTNQSGKQLHVNNEVVTYYLHLREQK